MKIAYSNLACPEWSMEEVFQNAVQFGYDGVEIRLVDGEVIRSDIDSDTQKRIVKLARDGGIDIIGLGASTRFATTDADVRRQNVEELLQYIELASNMGVSMVRTFGGGVPDKGAMQDGDDVCYVAEALNKIAPRAEELGVQVLLETHDEFSSSYLVKDVLQQIPSKYIGSIWDTHHPYRMNETVEETFGNLHERLGHVHLKDAKRNGDGWDLVVFGDGEVPVQQVVEKLMASGYDKYLCVEWEKKWHPEIERAATALPKHLEILRAYLR
jgi:sugar phosphate isomerase/epimerase